MRKVLPWLLGGSVALPLLIALAMLAGSLIPANGEWRQPREGVRIFVYSNGVHTGLVLPLVNAEMDWRPLVRADDLPDPARAGDHLLFGWGERDFYLNTPGWSDVSLKLVARALAGSDSTLVHVDHLRGVATGPDMRPVTLSAMQYSALAAAIQGDFAIGPDGRAAHFPGYGPDDIFYAGRGRYSLISTCNEWTGTRLRSIGVRVGMWTPFAQGVMWWF